MRYKMFKGHDVSTLGLGGLRFPTKSGDPNKIDRIEGQKVVDAAISCGRKKKNAFVILDFPPMLPQKL